MRQPQSVKLVFMSYLGSQEGVLVLSGRVLREVRSCRGPSGRGSGRRHAAATRRAAQGGAGGDEAAGEGRQVN